MAAALQGQRKPQGSRRLMDINGPDDRTEVDSHETPYTAVGFLRTGLPLGSYGSYSMCSASQISKRTVLTAGHCVYDTEKRTFYSDILYWPNRNGGGWHCHGFSCYGEQAYGAWHVTTWFANAPSPGPSRPLNEFVFDIAIITVGEDLDRFGWFGIGWDCNNRAYSVRTAGYPGDRTGGDRMFTTTGTTSTYSACGTSAWTVSPNLINSDLDTAGGQSGSGIWESNNIIRAWHVASGNTHRAVTRELYDVIYPHINPTVPPRNWAFNIRTSYGKCIHPYGGTGTTDNLGLVLYEGCSHQFKWLSNGAIQYVPTGKCLHPKEGSVSYLNQPVVLFGDCNAEGRPELRWEFLNNGQIRHVQSGWCLHSKDARNANDNPLVFWNTCTREPQCTFDYMLAK